MLSKRPETSFGDPIKMQYIFLSSIKYRIDFNMSICPSVHLCNIRYEHSSAHKNEVFLPETTKGSCTTVDAEVGLN